MKRREKTRFEPKTEELEMVTLRKDSAVPVGDTAESRVLFKLKKNRLNETKTYTIFAKQLCAMQTFLFTLS